MVHSLVQPFIFDPKVIIILEQTMMKLFMNCVNKLLLRLEVITWIPESCIYIYDISGSTGVMTCKKVITKSLLKLR